MEELDLECILDEGQLASLIQEESQLSQEEPVEKKPELNNTLTTENLNDELFGSEKVSEEDVDKNKDDLKNTPDPAGDGSESPNLYSSMLGFLLEEGVISNLSDEDLSKVKTLNDFRDNIKKQIEETLDEKQRRINDALDADIEPSLIKKYETYISLLDNITDDMVTAEGDLGINLRKLIISQDLLNKGFDKNRIQRELDKSFKNGSDIDDAKDALVSIKENAKNQYENLINLAKAEKAKEQEDAQKEVEALKRAILEDKLAFGEMELDQTTRQKIFDAIAKPTFRDKDGNRMTAIDKAESDDRINFLKHVGICYVLTDGFKNLDGLVKEKVNKEVKKHRADLERAINSTSRDASGNLNFINHNEHKDDNSHLSGWDLDLS